MGPAGGVVLGPTQSPLCLCFGARGGFRSVDCPDLTLAVGDAGLMA